MADVTPTGRQIPRRTGALSRDRILAAAVEILDHDGESALTFRALARRLATGAGAIYWHVASKDVLLAALTDNLIAKAIAGVPTDDTPREQLRLIALGLFDTFEAHPWLGTELSRETSWDTNARIYEAIGARVATLGVPAGSLFHAATVLSSYILGEASQNAAHARLARGLDRQAVFDYLIERWGRLDPAEYPFVHRTLSDLGDHDDREQFLSGVDFILEGIAAAAR